MLSEVNEDDIPDEGIINHGRSPTKADVCCSEYEPYQKNIDHLLVDMENDQYRFIYYQSIQRKKSVNTLQLLRYTEEVDGKQYAFLRS